MINLLPPESKRQIRAGQSNLLLLRYCIASLLLAALLGALIAGVYFIMSNSKRDAENLIQQSETSGQKYQKVKREASEFSNNLSTAKTIFDKDVLYSKIAVKIAQTLPPGVVLQSLQLDAKTFGQPMVLNAAGKNYDDSIRLKTALEESPIFNDVHLQSVSQSESEGDYPTTINISVTIDPESIKS